jgi:hypothetical protein
MSRSIPRSRRRKGNDYLFILTDSLRENGYRVYLYYNPDEMRSAWNARSAFPYDSLDKKAQPLNITLLRYLTSLGLKKDAQGVEQLTAHDIHAIESGIANVHYSGISNFKARLVELNWEYHQAISDQSPNGHSMAMRFEFWKAGLQILKEHLWTGVGTGDLQQAYNEQYDKMQSRLTDPWSCGHTTSIFPLQWHLEFSDWHTSCSPCFTRPCVRKNREIFCSGFSWAYSWCPC